jgi:hypothetical protein
MPKRLKGPVHQNDYAYEHMRYCKHNLPPDKVFVSMYGGMCRHCRELMDWKRKYGKWKILSPFTQEARICTHCAQKTVFHPFARICQKCCLALNKCSKCLKEATQGDSLASYPLTKAQQEQKQIRTERCKERMSERERRAIKRREAKGEEVELEYESDSEDEEEEDDGSLAGDLAARCSVADSRASRLRRQQELAPRRVRKKRTPATATNPSAHPEPTTGVGAGAPQSDDDDGDSDGDGVNVPGAPPTAGLPAAAAPVDEDFSDEEPL